MWSHPTERTVHHFNFPTSRVKWFFIHGFIIHYTTSLTGTYGRFLNAQCIYIHSSMAQHGSDFTHRPLVPSSCELSLSPAVGRTGARRFGRQRQRGGTTRPYFSPDALRFSHPLLFDTDLARPIVPSNEDRFDAPLSSVALRMKIEMVSLMSSRRSDFLSASLPENKH